VKGVGAGMNEEILGVGWLMWRVNWCRWMMWRVKWGLMVCKCVW